MRPLHLGLVAIGGRAWMGGANYVRNLAAAVSQVAPETRLTWFCGEDLVTDWEDVSPRIAVRQRSGLASWLVPPHRAFARLLRRAEVDLLYPLTYDNFYNLGLRFPLAAALGRTPWAGWIPDFQHRHLPDFFTAEERRSRDEQMERLIQEAPLLVLSSEAARADLERFFPGRPGPVRVLRFCVEPVAPAAAADASPAAAPERFFLCCNQWWKHKNHQLIFDALKILRGRGVRPIVLCTGNLKAADNDPYVEALRQSLRDDGLEGQIKPLGLIPREEQVALMRRALAVIQPSLFEGWSTVVEDARVLGRPILLSDLPVHREQDPPGAVYFSPHSAEDLAQVIAAAWGDLSPGPNFAAEEREYHVALERQHAFGAAFLELAAAQPRVG